MSTCQCPVCGGRPDSVRWRQSVHLHTTLSRVTTFLTTTRRWETFTHNSLLLVLLTIVNLATHNLGTYLYHPPLHYLRCTVISNSWVTTSYHGVTKIDGWLIEPDSPRLWVVSSVRCSKYPPIIYSSILHVRYFLHCLLCSDQGVGQVWLGAWRGGGHWTLDIGQFLALQ